MGKISANLKGFDKIPHVKSSSASALKDVNAIRNQVANTRLDSALHQITSFSFRADLNIFVSLKFQ